MRHRSALYRAVRAWRRWQSAVRRDSRTGGDERMRAFDAYQHHCCVGGHYYAPAHRAATEAGR